MRETTDFLVIGGGIVGLSVGRKLRREFPGAKITLIEKESQCGAHASSRNSGVLHAGFYYSSDSLKARFTQEGNKALRDYCKEKKLPLNPCGKLVVAGCEKDLAVLKELRERGERNGVPLEEVDEKQARQIEPRAKTFQKALFSPTTATVNPARVVESMKADASDEGIQILEGVRYLRREKDSIATTAGRYSCGYVVNCAGLYADKVARDFGFSSEYRILPFKGLYLYLGEAPRNFRTHVYPVPDLKNPFLGVHLTVTVDGFAKVGPTAIPAFWREQYQGFNAFKIQEFSDIVIRQAGLFLFSGFDFQKLAITEMRKSSKEVILGLASRLVKGIRGDRSCLWGQAGIRAQLVHVRTRKLEMDFVIQGDKRSCHVLNAVSPGFTCAIPFAGHVCEKIKSFFEQGPRDLSKGWRYPRGGVSAPGQLTGPSQNGRNIPWRFGEET